MSIQLTLRRGCQHIKTDQTEMYTEL